MASSKRQTTMAKLNRERKVMEKRERKQEKKAARLAAAEAGLYDPQTGETIVPPRAEVADENGENGDAGEADEAETAESERSTDPT
jgi:hypothetical protein